MYLDYKTHKAGVYVIDIETESLNPSIIWVMCWRNLLTGETGELTSVEDIQAFFRDTASAIYIGHNILHFDAPVLSRLTGAELDVSNCIDTLVLSTLYSPSLAGGHSLEAWGERIGAAKIEFDDWSALTPEMIEYCHQDVTVTAKLFVRLIRTLERIGFPERAIWLQHHMTDVVREQRNNGFKFDGPRAQEFYRTLRAREKELEHEIHKAFPPVRTLVAERSLLKKDGGFTAIYLKDTERYEVEEDYDTSTYKAYEQVPFNLGSPKQRVEKLVELGWEPKEFTEKGNPRPFDKGKLSPSLEAFLEDHDVPEVLLIAKWMSINGRANMVNTWLEAYNERTGCIHGKLFTADTLRFRHQAPNTANIPAVRVDKESGKPLLGEHGFFTYEARDLWVARDGRVLVGTDASGLELRMLAHYLNRPEFTEQVVEGDPHQYNADLAGVTRPEAKTLIYAILYGAGGPKIARTLGLPVYQNSKGYDVSPEGDEMKEMFLDRLGATQLVEECKNEQKRGRVTLCDGSKVVCPSPHAALNYKLQGGGARVMGLGAVLLKGFIQSRGLDSLKVGDIHDEWQFDVDPSDAEEHAALAVEAIRRSGVRLQLNVPLDGESKIGRTWAETH